MFSPRRLTLLVVIFIVLTIAFLNACTPSAAQPAKEPAAQERTTPVIDFPFDDPPFWCRQATESTDATGVKVNCQVVPFQKLHDTVQAALTSGQNEYDVIHIHQGWLKEWCGGETGFCYPLDGYVSEEIRSRFPPGTLAQLTDVGADGKVHVYGIPLYLWITELYYRTDLVATPPTTFRELAEMAKQVQEETGVYGFGAALGGSGPATWFEVVLRGEGHEFLRRDSSGKLVPDFNNDAGLRALELMVEMAKDGTIHPSSFEHSSSVRSVDLFTQGEAALFIGPPPTWPFAQDPERSEIVGNVGVALMPGGSATESATYYEVGSRAIAYNAPDPGAAWKFIEFVTLRPKQVKAMALELGRIPVLPEVLNDPEVQENYPPTKIISEQLQYPSGLFAHKNGTEIRRVLADHILAALRFEKSPQEALNDAAKDVETILER